MYQNYMSDSHLFPCSSLIQQYVNIVEVELFHPKIQNLGACNVKFYNTIVLQINWLDILEMMTKNISD